MSTLELLNHLKHLSNVERLTVIEEATRLVREGLSTSVPSERAVQDRRMQAAALGVKDLYEPGGDLTEWTSLDSEDVADDYVQG